MSAHRLRVSAHLLGTLHYYSEVRCNVLFTYMQGSKPRGIIGMILSRVGLWAFDLCQLKELQMALATHPRRNSMYVFFPFVAHLRLDLWFPTPSSTALQFSLQNIADMLKVRRLFLFFHG